MGPEDKKILTETLELVQDNNRILKKLLTAQRLGISIAVIKWVVIIGASVGIYYLFQPIIDQLKGVYSGLGDFYQSTGSFFNDSPN